jgi:hypothetical protein
MWKATERGIGRLDVDLVTFGAVGWCSRVQYTKVIRRLGSDNRQIDSCSGQAQP